MKKYFAVFVFVFGMMYVGNIGGRHVAWALPDQHGTCSMTIYTSNDWNHKAQASGLCNGLEEGYYLKGQGFTIIGMDTFPVKYSGQKFVVSTPSSNTYLDATMTVTTVNKPKQTSTTSTSTTNTSSESTTTSNTDTSSSSTNSDTPKSTTSTSSTGDKSTSNTSTTTNTSPTSTSSTGDKSTSGTSAKTTKTNTTKSSTSSPSSTSTKSTSTSSTTKSTSEKPSTPPAKKTTSKTSAKSNQTSSHPVSKASSQSKSQSTSHKPSTKGSQQTSHASQSSQSSTHDKGNKNQEKKQNKKVTPGQLISIYEKHKNELNSLDEKTVTSVFSSLSNQQQFTNVTKALTQNQIQDFLTLLNTNEAQQLEGIDTLVNQFQDLLKNVVQQSEQKSTTVKKVVSSKVSHQSDVPKKPKKQEQPKTILGKVGHAVTNFFVSIGNFFSHLFSF